MIRRTGKRVILRLTPLLDLLLIVMFAQYMELQATTDAQVEAEKTRRAEALSTRQEFARANRRLEERVESLQEDNRLLRDQVATRRSRQEELEENLQAVTEIARKQLQIPADVVRHALAEANVDQTRRLKEELEDLRRTSLAEVIRYLRKNLEFRNHWDVWEVHIDGKDSLRLIRNDQVLVEDLFVTNPDNFVQTVGGYFGQAEPKSTILILLSWGDASFGTRTLVKAGLEDLRAVLRDKWARPKKIHISTLGFIPEMP
jgi:hypothetical protein